MAKMLLTNLHLYTNYSSKGLIGTVTFAGQAGEVKINVDQERASRIIEIVAEEVVASAQDVARMLVSTVLDQVKQESLAAPKPNFDDSVDTVEVNPVKADSTETKPDNNDGIPF